jgi:AraC-like DNA-binding protein
MIVFTDGKVLNDLSLYECGMRRCDPGFNCGPVIRDLFIIHYVLDGAGIYETGNKIYFPRKGEGFLIVPGRIVRYRADVKNPWHYAWVGFHGAKAEVFLKKAGITADCPVFKIEQFEFVEDSFHKMMDAEKIKFGRELYLTGYLSQLLAVQIEAFSKRNPFLNQNRKEYYVSTAVNFIKENYSSDIGIHHIAKQVGIDGKYLSAIFKECLNTSPYRYLMDTRMNKACELMDNGLLTIGDIARSVGYTDPLLFSKMFKKSKGKSPREYRKCYSCRNMQSL